MPQEDALDHKAKMKRGEPQDYGILMAFALDTMYGRLEMYGCVPADLHREDFVPEKELLETRDSREAGRKRP